MNLRKYFGFSRVSFRESAVYRVDVLTSLISSGLFLVLYYFVWSAIASAGELNSSLGEIMIYFVIGQVVTNTVFVNVEKFVGERIRRGTIVNELKRPIGLFSQAYFDQLGSIVFNFVSKSLPIALLGFYIVDFALPSLYNLIIFSLSLFLGFNLVFLFSFSTSMLIFWTKVEWSVRGTRNHIQKILSGTLFPLFLLPDYLKPFFNLLPFQAMVDGPIRIFMGLGLEQSVMVLLNQIVWCLIFLVVSRLSWRKAKNKLTVQGG